MRMATLVSLAASITLTSAVYPQAPTAGGVNVLQRVRPGGGRRHGGRVAQAWGLVSGAAGTPDAVRRFDTVGVVRVHGRTIRDPLRR